MQHYQTLQQANSYITAPDGTRRYSRYEVGVIDGRYRAMPVLIADKAGFDGLGFDASVGSGDDHYTVLNLFDGSHKYIDSVAVVGADDDDHAAHLALSQFDYLGADYATVVVNDSAQFDDMSLDALGQRGWSSQAIAQLMNHPSQNTGYYLPIINSKMLRTEQNRVTADNVMWDGANLVSHGSDYSRLLLDLQKHDAFGGLTAKFDMRELLADLGATELGFDALMETYSRLDAMGDRLFTALGRHAVGDLTVTNVTTTKPFKRQGVANVAMQFDLSDGQTFSIIFHNPDADPKKLAANDTMVSWKWLLNKKDVTAAVSPKQSDKVRYDVIASRIMKVAAKNSKRFVAAQMKKAQNQEKITEAQKAVDDKQAYLEQLDKDIAELKQQIDDFRLSDEAVAVSTNKAKASSRQKITVQPLSAIEGSATDDLIDKAMKVAAKDIDKIVQDIRMADKKKQNAESLAEKTDIMEQKNRLNQKLKNARLKLFDIEDAITAFYRNGTSLDDVDLLELFPKVAALIGVGQSINEAAAVGEASQAASTPTELTSEWGSGSVKIYPQYQSQYKALSHAWGYDGDFAKIDTENRIEIAKIVNGVMQGDLSISRELRQNTRFAATIKQLGLPKIPNTYQGSVDWVSNNIDEFKDKLSNYEYFNRVAVSGDDNATDGAVDLPRDASTSRSTAIAESNANQLTELDEATRSRLKDALPRFKTADISDESLALIALVVDRAGGSIAETDLDNLYGATNRLFSRKPLNSYYLKGDYSLSQPIIDAYNKVLDELDGNSGDGMLNYILTQAQSAKVSVELAQTDEPLSEPTEPTSDLTSPVAAGERFTYNGRTYTMPNDDYKNSDIYNTMLEMFRVNPNDAVKAAEKAISEGEIAIATMQNSQSPDANILQYLKIRQQQRIDSLADLKPQFATDNNAFDGDYIDTFKDDRDIFNAIDKAQNALAEKGYPAWAIATANGDYVAVYILPDGKFSSSDMRESAESAYQNMLTSRENQIKYPDRHNAKVLADRNAQAAQPHPAYSQDDIAFLNDIVSGKIEPLPKATRARVREIGSKDKTDPLFLQVVDIISDATDKLTRG